MSARPFLWVVIGPNGSGKSTYYAYVVAPRLKAEFINADVIAQDRFGDEAESRSYEAARVAADRRVELLADGTSFVFETVFSHPSKLEFLRDARSLGYQVWVSFLFVGSADLAVERVARRVREGATRFRSRRSASATSACVPWPCRRCSRPTGAS